MRVVPLVCVGAAATSVHALRAKNDTHGDVVTAIDNVHVATFQNAYGTQFQCTSACWLILVVYLVAVVVLLVLLAIIPVQSLSSAETAPFLWWLKSQPYNEDSDQKQQRGQYRRSASAGEPSMRDATTTPDAAPIEEAKPPTTYETMGVETDDSLFPPVFPMSLSHQHDVASIDIPPGPEISPVGSERRLGIFSLKPESPVKSDVGAMQDPDDMASLPPSPERKASMQGSPQKLAVTQGSPRRQASPQKLSMLQTPASLDDAGVEEAKDEVAEALENQRSMQRLAERRKQQAEADANRENLGQQGIETFEYLEFVRDMMSGIQLTKVTQRGRKPVKRTFFVTPDLATIYWNSIGRRGWINKKSSIQSGSIDKVIKGLHDDPKLEAQGAHDGGDSKFLSITTQDGRHLDLKVDTEAAHRRLFHGFSKLGAVKRQEEATQLSGQKSTAEEIASTASPPMQEATTHDVEAPAQVEAVSGNEPPKGDS